MSQIYERIVYTMDTISASAPAAATYKRLGTDRLLSTNDLCEILGCCPKTAKRIARESGFSIITHRKVFVLESSFLHYMASLQETFPEEVLTCR